MVFDLITNKANLFKEIFLSFINFRNYEKYDVRDNKSEKSSLDRVNSFYLY